MPVVQKLRCQLEEIIDYGDHVYTVALRPERPAPRFLPGQFLHLALDEYDPSGFWPESRVFSIASSPAQRDCLRISYSVRGRFTSRMEKEIQQGRWVWVKLPYGEFVIPDQNDVVLFAGGTGITAFTSFLDGLSPQFRHRVYLAYGARRRSLLISMYPYRRKLVEEISDYNLAIWGKGWAKVTDPRITRHLRGGDIRGSRKTKAISGSAISLNPHHPLNDIHGTNSRTIDIAACRGFQIADYKKDLEAIFKIGEEIICFRTLDELKSLIPYYFKHSEERAAIADAAYQRVIKEHTYEVRARAILYLIKK